MKICRYNDARLGVVKGESVFDVSEALGALAPATYPFPRHDVLIENLPSMRAHLDEMASRASPIALSSVRLLSPVANPGKIVAAPVNYTRHLEEVLAQRQLHHGNLINEIHKAGLFLKATSSLIGAGSPVTLVHTDRRNDHEVELAVVIGKRCRNVQRDQALSCVAGYAIGLDITIRGPEERSLRKSPDGYTVLGPWLTTSDELTDPGQLDFSIHVDGELRQQANTSELILGVPELIEFASSFYTLEPGDIILTGTPQGVGPIVAGNRMLAAIEGIGSMEVAVQ
ncbi:MAG: fumarylacetoacetate hydrolase family protein [Hydrogenophaga sp.]|jgi:2-keto-4-pentenoate hydratase/2-oxohepta-3-ene-1,7-dioic acid hydratase in catechol pathway|nr:fumarylacetoacetate hydrolase family protein [Hydrogenophaga sp.]